MTDTTPNTETFTALGCTFALDDISAELARRAFSNLSFNSDRRGEQARVSYMVDMRHAAQLFEEAATAHPDRRERAADMMASYKAGYLKRLNAYLASASGCASWFITGPARFPVRQQEKRHNSMDNRAAELHDFATRRLARMVKLLTRPERQTAQERADDLTRRIEQREARQAMMKEANKIIRSKKLHEQLEKEGLTVTDALVTLGLSEAKARAIQSPDFAGRIGFADYELTNNNAEIKRLRARLAEEKAKAAQAATSSAPAREYDTPEDGPVIYEECPDDNRIRLTFEGKPSADTRAILKRHGFKWSPNAGAWQRFLTGNGQYAARQALKALNATPRNESPVPVEMAQEVQPPTSQKPRYRLNLDGSLTPLSQPA